MPVQTLQDGTQVITGDSIQVYHMLRQRKALQLEIKGIRFKGSVAQAIRQQYGLTARTRVKLLAEFEELLTSKGIQFT